MNLNPQQARSLVAICLHAVFADGHQGVAERDHVRKVAESLGREAEIDFIALYQDWVPFLWNVAFTVISHGIGTIWLPSSSEIPAMNNKIVFFLWLVAAAGQRHTAQDHVGQLDDDKVEGDAFVFAGEGDGGVTGQRLRLGQMLQQLRRCRVAHPRQRDF